LGKVSSSTGFAADRICALLSGEDVREIVEAMKVESVLWLLLLVVRWRKCGAISAGCRGDSDVVLGVVQSLGYSR